MVSILKDILVLLGIPGKIIASILLAGLLVFVAIKIDRSYNNHENALQSSVQYKVEGKQKDSLIISMVTDFKSAVIGKLDSIKKDLHSVKTIQAASQKINSEKFKLIIQDNKSLKNSFDAFDNSLDWIKQTISYSEKKKPIPLFCLSDNTK